LRHRQENGFEIVCGGRIEYAVVNVHKLHLIPNNIAEIRIAIAGMGKMGNFHFTALKQLAAGEHEDYYKGGISEYLTKIRIVGICDTEPLRLDGFRGISGFASVEEMLDRTQPHILIVATPTQTHRQIAVAAIRRGIHTFVEKPIVTSVTDMDELLNAAQKSGVRIIAGHIERYNPVSIKIRSVLRNVDPPAKEYFFCRTQRHPSRITDDIVIDKVIHDLDLAICFFGNVRKIEIADIKMVQGQVYEVRVLLEHKQGTKGSCFVSWLMDTDAKKREVEILQGGHKWKGDFVTKQLWVDGLEIKCEVDGMIKPANNQIKDELVDFIASCIDSGPLQAIPPLLSIDEIIESTKWLENISNMVLKS
jgi:predicted dehydrogenase